MDRRTDLRIDPEPADDKSAWLLQPNDGTLERGDAKVRTIRDAAIPHLQSPKGIRSVLTRWRVGRGARPGSRTTGRSGAGPRGRTRADEALTPVPDKWGKILRARPQRGPVVA